MVKSFRGKEFNMLNLATQNSSNMAIGNVRVNGRGDLIGRNGEIVKTREEQIKEYMEKHSVQTGTASIKKAEPDSSKNQETKSEQLDVAPAKTSKKKEKTVETQEQPAPEVVLDEN